MGLGVRVWGSGFSGWGSGSRSGAQMLSGFVVLFCSAAAFGFPNYHPQSCARY